MVFIVKEIEKKWQKKWRESKIFEADPDNRKKFFITFPYPYQNATAHLGHAFTFLRNEFFARYKRMKGYNVLFPQGWHATGGPIVAAALRVKEGDQKQINILKSLGVRESEIKKFENPEYWVHYFTKRWREDFEEIGMSVDWRREFFTTYLNKAYSKFIEWQYTKLKEKGFLVKGKHAVVWCPKEKKVVGDHDRPDEYAGIVPEEVVLLKFKDENGRIYPCTTFRVETVYGVTNIWVNPEEEYVEIKIDNESWIVSEKCLNNLKEQRENIKVVRSFSGKEILNKTVENPVTENSVPILPANFVDASFGTGVVMSVPAHAPYDYIALKDLGKDIMPVSLISVEGYGEFPAIEICEKMGIKNQKEKDKLEKATKEIYTIEFHKGVLKKIFGKYAGLKVSEAKEKLIEEFLSKGFAEKYYILPESVKCRCGSWTRVKIISDQWFLNYSNPEWKKTAHRCIDKMKFFPEEIKTNFHSAIDWLKDWACTHKNELGTSLPFDKEWVVESLSDSTIYMAYYTIAKYLQRPEKYGIKIENLKNSLFDFIFLGKGDVEKIANENSISKELLEEMRNEFLYWYPVDFRNSAKELAYNHLPFFIFHHVAIFPENLWPKSIALNGWVLIEGEKMSKSKGNFITVREALEKWGADVTRLIEAHAGSPGTEDPNIDLKFIETAERTIKGLNVLVEKFYNKGREHETLIDRWFVSVMNRNLKNITELMEETRFKEVIGKAVFENQNNLNWYLRRTGNNPNRNVMNKFIKTQILILSPFIPHICEELWEKLGNRSFVSLERWPNYDEKLIDGKIEKQEELIKRTIEDINELKKIVRGVWKRINIYISPEWKYKVCKIAEKKPEDLIAELMKLDEIKKHGNEAIKYARSLKHKEAVLSQKEEMDVLKFSEDFLEREFKCEVKIMRAEDSESEKAKRAEPGKPGIEVIT